MPTLLCVRLYVIMEDTSANLELIISLLASFRVYHILSLKTIAKNFFVKSYNFFRKIYIGSIISVAKMQSSF